MFLETAGDIFLHSVNRILAVGHRKPGQRFVIVDDSLWEWYLGYVFYLRCFTEKMHQCYDDSGCREFQLDGVLVKGEIGEK